MRIIIVDENYNGALESQLEQSVLKLIKDARESGCSLKNILKLNVFLKTGGEYEIKEIQDELAALLKKEFSQNMPAYSVLGLASLSGNDVMLEAVFLDGGSGLKIERNVFYKHSYVVLSAGKSGPRLVISGGINVSDAEDIVFECQRAFDFAEQLLLKEDLDFSHIIEQSNYIPSMSAYSKYGGADTMNLQIFENVRTLYYDPDIFKSGYPEFTATGTTAGNVTLDFIALSDKVPSEGGSENDDIFSNLFLAGRMSEGLRGESVEVQALALIKSIKDGFSYSDENDRITYLKIYLKNRNDLLSVRNIVDQNIQAANIVFIEAEISNDMKIYIEAIR